VNDLGAVFYNPGRLGLIEDPTFILSADVYEYSRASFKNVPGNNISLATSDLGAVPGFLAGAFKFKRLPKHKFSYSALTRQRSDSNLRYREEFKVDIDMDIPGDEDVSSAITLNEKLRQQWYSLSWAYPLTEDLSIGVTFAGVRYNSSKVVGVDIRALSAFNDLGSYQFDRYYNFTRYGFLFKVGIAKQNPKFNWGITLTTPLVGLFGKGELDYSAIYEPLKEESEVYFATAIQSGLEVTYKLPLSIGGGISFKVPKAEICFSSEWFTQISRYTILEAEQFIPESGGDPVNFRVVDDLKGVINFGVGAEYQVKEDLRLYLSASTDFSAVRDGTDYVSNDIEIENNAFTSNLYHFASGVVFDIRNSDITLGVTYTGASQPLKRTVDLPDDEPLIPDNDRALFKWTRIQLVVGFSLSFLEN